MQCVAVRDLTFCYPEQTRCALQDVSFSLERGAFAVLCGPSGCGKSTLLRQFKSALAPHGFRRGEVLFESRPLDRVDAREQAAAIGFVQQSPDNQIVTDRVWHELAFGLESLGFDTPTIRGRVAEMASFFGIEAWFHREISKLSGGQKQLLSLASVLTMQPRLLILDEPTSQLDPIAASEFLAALVKVNRELGVTVLLTEQRLEEALPLCDRVLVLDGGRLIAQGDPRAVGQTLKTCAHDMFEAMPTAMRVWAAVEDDAPCPVTVRDGRAWLETYQKKHPLGLPLDLTCVRREDAKAAGISGAQGACAGNGNCAADAAHAQRDRADAGQLCREVYAAVNDADGQTQQNGVDRDAQPEQKCCVAPKEEGRGAEMPCVALQVAGAGRKKPRRFWPGGDRQGEKKAPKAGQDDGSEKKNKQTTCASRLTFDGVWFRYEQHGPDIVKGLSLDVRQGELFALLGGNGAGKSTVLSLAAGLQKPHSGQLRVGGNIGFLPQQAQALFVKKTVGEDLLEALLQGARTPSRAQLEELQQRVLSLAEFCRLEALLERHPFDLSGGEQQRAALAKVLLREPDILLLDEPTKGMDAAFKRDFAGLLKTLCANGAAILMVSHDVEFCAEHADRCALFFDGGAVTQGSARAFFSGNSFYTTAANRMARDLLPGAVTAMDVIAACRAGRGADGEASERQTARQERQEADALGAAKEKTPVFATPPPHQDPAQTCAGQKQGATPAKAGEPGMGHAASAGFGAVNRGDDCSAGDPAGADVVMDGSAAAPSDVSATAGVNAAALAQAGAVKVSDAVNSLASPGCAYDADSAGSFARTNTARQMAANAVGAAAAPAIDAFGGSQAGFFEKADAASHCFAAPAKAALSPGRGVATLPLWRRALAALSALVVALVFVRAAGIAQLPPFDGWEMRFGGDAGLYLTALVALLVFALATWRPAAKPVFPVQMPLEKRKLPRRTVAAAVMILMLIPLTLYVGVVCSKGRSYNLIALLILFETMLPFVLIFEGRRPQARELVVIAVLCALGVAGRATFFMLPQFKPVMALVILSGVAFGGETGFLVGAMTMLISNVLFGQGPWTPWQMFAMGIVGFLAGVLFQKGLLRRTRSSLCAFGALSAIVIYGVILSAASALLWMQGLNIGILWSYCLAGLPMDLLQAAATVVFLWFFSQPLLDKLDRVKVKYGLME